jgi:hypothetical protein
MHAVCGGRSAVRPGRWGITGREPKSRSRRPGNTWAAVDRRQNRILTGSNVLNRAISIFLTGSCAQLVGFGFDWGQGWSHRPKSGTANGLRRRIWQQVRAGGGWRDGVAVAGRSSVLPAFWFVSSLWPVHGRFGWSSGRCGVAAAGEPWFTLGCEGVRRRAEALVVAGATGWEWLVCRACCCFMVRFVTSARERSVALGVQVGAAVSPRPGRRGLRWGGRGFGGERKRWWWLEPRGGTVAGGSS